MAKKSNAYNWNVSKNMPAVSTSEKKIAEEADKALQLLERLQGHLKVKEFNHLVDILGLTAYYEGAK